MSSGCGNCPLEKQGVREPHALTGTAEPSSRPLRPVRSRRLQPHYRRSCGVGSGWQSPLGRSRQQGAESGEPRRWTDRPRFLRCPIGSAAAAVAAWRVGKETPACVPH